MDQFSPPISYAGWLACAGFTIWIVSLALKLTDRFKAHPPAGELHLSAQQLHERVEKLEADKAAIEEKIELVREQERKDASDRRKEIYNQIRATEAQISRDLKEMRGEIKGDVDALNERINELILAVGRWKDK